MEFGGKYVIQAPRNQVWRALNDADVLQEVIPGCKKIEWVSETDLEVSVSVNLGITRPTFVGDLTLSNIIPAENYTLSGRGRGGILGHAQGAADIVLADHAQGTFLTFTAVGGASGQIMRLGRTIVGASTQKIIDRFFERFASAMGATITPQNES